MEKRKKRKKTDYTNSLQALERILEVLCHHATPKHPLTVREILQNIERVPVKPQKPPMKKLPSYATVDSLLRRVIDDQIDIFPYTLECVARISDNKGEAKFIPYDELYDQLDDEEERANNRPRRYYLAPLLTLGECHMLADLVRSTPYISEPRTRNLLRYLDHLYPKEVSRRIPPHDYHFKRGQSERMSEVARVLNQAIADRQKVRLLLGAYQLEEANGKVKPLLQTRKLGQYLDMSPYALIWSGGNYYLLGKGFGIICLRVDRIMQAESLPVHFDFPSDFDPHRRRDSSLMRPGQPTHVRLRCREDALDDMMDAFGNLPQYTAPKHDGPFDFFEATLSATSTAVMAFALAHLDTVEVLEPASLRQELLNTLRQGAEKYGS